MIFVTPSSGLDSEADSASSVADAPDALPAGTAVGSFVLSGVASHDEFGICYRASASASDTQVTIEEYAPAQISRRAEDGVLVPSAPDHAELLADGQRAFLHEAEQFSRLSHPSLLRIGPTWRVRGTAYRLRIGGEGRGLAAVLDGLGTRPDEPWLRRFLAPLLDALDLVHTGGWVHGNLRPGQVAMREDGTPVLLDSGAVALTLASRLPSPRAWAESQFLPVELLESSSTLPVGPWSDLYSLAALVVWCRTGHLPEDGADWQRGAAACGGLRRALEAALQADPARRPQGVAEFRELMKDTREPREPREAATPHEARAPAEASAAAAQAAAVKDMLVYVTGHGHGPAAGSRHPASGLAPLSDAREPGWSEAFDPPARREEPVEDDEPGWLAAARADAPRRFSFAQRSRRWPWALGGAAAGAAITAVLTLFVLRPTPELHWTPGASLGALASASADDPPALPGVGSGAAAPAGARSADGRAPHAAEAARRVAAPGPAAGPAPTLNGAAGAAPTGTAVEAAVAGAAPGTVADPAGLAPPMVAGRAPAVAAAAAPTPSPVAAPPTGGGPTSVAGVAGGAAPLAGVAAPAATGVPPVPGGTSAPGAVVAGAAPIAPSPAAALLEKTTDAGGAAGGSRVAPVHASTARGGSERDAAGGDAREAIAAARREEAELAENPAAACSPRTNFALYRCMQNQCEQRRFFTHPQCIRLRVRDEVS